MDKEKRWKIWEEAEREPTEDEKRQMMKESLKIAMETIMNNHTYKFEDVIRKQKEGGAIGSDLTGEMTRIFMRWWDRQIIEKLNKVGIKVLLYKRYVDDINMVVEILKGNYKYESGKLMREERPERAARLREERPERAARGTTVEDDTMQHATEQDRNEDEERPERAARMREGRPERAARGTTVEDDTTQDTTEQDRNEDEERPERAAQGTTV